MDDFNYFGDLSIYEVEKIDYDAYFHRLPKAEIMKTTPRDGMVVYKDIVEGCPICGILTENVMAMPANQYYIFNFMDESRLGPHKAFKHIQLSEEEYTDFLKRLQEIAKGKEDA